MNTILTMTDAAKLLGINAPDKKQAGAKCLRMLRAIEKQRDAQLLFKQSNSIFYTTDAALKNVLPELFEEDRFTADTIQSLKETVTRLKDQVANLHTKVNSLNSTIQSMKDKR